MKQRAIFYLLLLALVASCSNDIDPDQPAFRIIATNSPMDINGVIERNGEVSIFGSNPEFIQVFSRGALSQCLEIADFPGSIPKDNQIPLYSTLSADGRTWRENDTFASNIRDVFFLDDNTGFLQTRLEGLFKTTNSGDTWHQVLKGNVTYSCYNLYWLRFDRVNFKNEMEGYVLDSNPFDHNFILKTMDGGNSWNLLYPTETELVSGQSREARDLYFVPNSQVAYWKSGFYQGYRKSIDGGQTWDVISEETGAEDIQFANANVGFYVQNEAVFKTTDGGQTWANAAADLSVHSPNKIHSLEGLTHLNVVDENTLYVTAESPGNDVFQSLDGGQIFTQLIVPAGAGQIKGTYLAPSGKLYAYGLNGLLMVLK